MDILSYILGKKAGGGGGEAVLINKSVTANGTYNASADSADGYKKVEVSVPNTYAAGDEGKVVSNGALVAQGSDTVTANDTYDTTLISELTVNVSGGGGTELDSAGEYPVAEEDTITVGTGFNGLINVVKKKTLIHSWDFTTGLVDSVGGVTATLGNGATQSAEGVTIAGATQHIATNVTFEIGRTYEIDVASMTKNFSSGHGRLFMLNGSEGFIKQNGSDWKFYGSGVWSVSAGSTDPASKTVTITFGRGFDTYANGTVTKQSPASVYFNSDLFLRSNNITKTVTDLNKITLGASANSYYTMVITGFRIYDGVDMTTNS